MKVANHRFSLSVCLSLFHTHLILVHHISGRQKKLEIWLKHNHRDNNLVFGIYRLMISSFQHHYWNFSALCIYLCRWYLCHLISYILYGTSENYSIRFSIFAIFSLGCLHLGWNWTVNINLIPLCFMSYTPESSLSSYSSDITTIWHLLYYPSMECIYGSIVIIRVIYNIPFVSWSWPVSLALLSSTSQLDACVIIV